MTVGAPISYNLRVTNAGPDLALSVRVNDTLPASLQFVSAAADQGSCVEITRLVSCNIGDIPAGSSVGINLVVKTTLVGMVTNNASVSANTIDPDLTDNTASGTTTVEGVDKLIYLPLAIK